jgi:5'-3' exonuclease
MPEVRAPDGSLVNAVVGFVNFIERLLRDRKPAQLYVAFEFGSDWRPQFRVALLPEYKSARVATSEDPPDEVEPQLLVIAEIMRTVGITIANASECEAEDVIATLTTRIAGPIEIVSGDRDLYTLVRDPRIRVLFTLRGVTELATVDQAWIHAKYGIPGDRYLDYAILRGDPSDGLPGVRGIGEKTASQLLAKYGSLDAILAAKDLSATIRAKLNASKDYLVAARRVVGPVLDCSIDVTGDGSLPAAPRDAAKLAGLAERHGVQASIRRLVAALGGAPIA